MPNPNAREPRLKIGLGAHVLKGNRFDLQLNDELVSSLNDLMQHSGDSPEEVFRKALALYKVGVEAKEEDNRLAIVGPDGEIVQEIVGL